jgi:23S rRNA (cytosine1962-C5)-methyltransferase
MTDAGISRPKVIVSRRGAERLRAGHVWVYRSDVLEAKDVLPGALVLVQELSDKKVRPTRALVGPSDTASHRGGRGRPPHTRILGSALYSTASEIAVRMISPRPVSDLEQLVRERIRAAAAYRGRFVANTNAYRVLFSEADFLPGLIVDRYNDLLSVQIVTQAMDAEAMRTVVVSELRDALSPAAIIERVDPRVRRLEQLADKESGVIYEATAVMGETGGVSTSDGGGGSAGAGRGRPALHNPLGDGATTETDPTLGAPDPGRGRPGLRESGVSWPATEFQMNGVRFVYDALGGQKTGAFLDQRENYAAAAQYARGEALDVFCYQGGFALHLADKCSNVTGVDSSRPALEMAERNASLNKQEIEWIEANAFDLLRDYADAGRQYDYVVLDPPAFAKSRQNLQTALRGYKELNLRALKMLRPGGILVTCSCSYHVSAADLLETVTAAGVDSHRNLRLLESRGAAKDHPTVLGIPETAYLKCLILLVN